MRTTRRMAVVWMVAIMSAVVLAAWSARAGDFQTDWDKLVTDFAQGGVSNFLVVGGANYNSKTHGWGGEGLIGYNLPKFPVPLQPYLIPLVGLTYLGNSWEGFSGTVSLNKDLYPLRLFNGGATNGFRHDFSIAINGLGGVGTDLSGSQFGPITVPGRRAADGQGTAAVTGEGASVGIFKTQSVALGVWFERMNWTTISGDILAGGLTLKYSPKGW